MDANAYRIARGRGENEGSAIIVLKDDPLTRLGIVFPRTCMAHALRGGRIIRMTPRICGYVCTHTRPRTRHPHVLPTRRRSLINDDSAALLHHCLDTRSTCPRLHTHSAAARLRACALASRARRMFTNYDRIRSRDQRRNINFC